MASVAPEAGELAPEGKLAPETKRPWKLCSETMQVKVIVVVMTVVMAAFEVGDRMGCRLDLGAGTLSFFKNGAPHGPGHTGVVGPVKRCVEIGAQGNSVTVCEGVSFQ